MLKNDADLTNFLFNATRKKQWLQNISVTLCLKWYRAGIIRDYKNNRVIDRAVVNRIKNDFFIEGFDVITVYIDNGTIYLVNGHHRMIAVSEMSPSELENVAISVRVVSKEGAIKTYSKVNTGKAHTTRDKLSNTDMLGGAFLHTLAQDAGFSGLKDIPQNFYGSLLDASLYLADLEQSVTSFDIADIKAGRNKTVTRCDKTATEDSVVFKFGGNYHVMVDVLSNILHVHNILEEKAALANKETSKYLRLIARSAALITLFVQEAVDTDLEGILDVDTFIKKACKNPQLVANVLSPISRRSVAHSLHTARGDILGIVRTSRKRDVSGVVTEQRRQGAV